MLRFMLFTTVFIGCTSDSKNPNEAETGDSDSAEAVELQLRTEFGDAEEMSVYTDDIYAIWWYPSFDHRADAEQMAEQLKFIRRDCLERLELRDPPNPEAGYYYNVYIHHGEEDDFPTEWGNGQGTDSYGMPFLTLPTGAHIDEGNLYHEGFHIFQYTANAPGFAYAGDSQWYIETTAQWYMASFLPEKEDAFVEVGALVANPQLTLWHSFSNEAPGDPVDWLYQVRQYGMHAYPFYLTTIEGVNSELITNGFFSGTELLPQEYLYTNIGAENLRQYFANWAAHNTGGLDYLTPEQVARAWLEVEWVGDPNNLHPNVIELVDAGTDGEWIRPPEDYTTRGWAYNVIHIQNTQAATYSFFIDGDEFGSEGAASHFEGRIVVMQEGAASYSSLEMSNALDGSGQVVVTADVTDVYLVVVSVPEHFRGNQKYGYAIRIERE